MFSLISIFSVNEEEFQRLTALQVSGEKRGISIKVEPYDDDGMAVFTFTCELSSFSAQLAFQQISLSLHDILAETCVGHAHGEMQICDGDGCRERYAIYEEHPNTKMKLFNNAYDYYHKLGVLTIQDDGFEGDYLSIDEIEHPIKNCDKNF